MGSFVGSGRNGRQGTRAERFGSLAGYPRLSSVARQADPVLLRAEGSRATIIVSPSLLAGTQALQSLIQSPEHAIVFEQGPFLGLDENGNGSSIP